MHTAADVTFIIHAIARALTDSELQAPSLDNFPPLTRCDSKTIVKIRPSGNRRAIHLLGQRSSLHAGFLPCSHLHSSSP